MALDEDNLQQVTAISNSIQFN